MLIARAPMRISFSGGGTDLEAYYARYGGLVISTAINKYFYAILTTEEADDLQVISKMGYTPPCPRNKVGQYTRKQIYIAKKDEQTTQM